MGRQKLITPEVHAQLQMLPQRAGIYLFLDGNGEVLYLGKSVNLRRRVSSYFHGDLRERDTRYRRLVSAIRQVRHFRCSSNLLALLLEDTLIKAYHPPNNVRQKKYKGYQYLRFTTDRYPRLENLSELPEDPGEVFGPFPDGYFIERMEAFLGRYFGLRNCRERDPVESCLQADLGLCLAPCVDETGAKEYARMIERVRGFIRGDSKDILKRVKTEMTTAATAESFETAARCRDDLLFGESFFRRQAFTHQFANLELQIRDLRAGQPDYVFHHGNLIRLKKRGSPLPGDKALLELCTVGDRRYLLDRAHIVFSWLKRHKLTSEHQFLIA